MEVQQNVLYVMTQGAYVRRDHLVLQVEIENKIRLAVPVHHLHAVAMFGNVMVSPGALHLCAESGIAVTFLSESGRLLARVDAPSSGNVLLRREQFRQADRPADALRHARCFIAGKLQGARNNVLRAARDNAAEGDSERLQLAGRDLAASIRSLERAEDMDQARGVEGSAARTYFGVFDAMTRQDREGFRMVGRSRRPPLDRTNAMLSFTYALLLTDCIAGLTAAGLDPNVGYLHTDRPGRPSLALDLMEEFRPQLADRLVLSLINRRQVTTSDFRIREGGSVEMTDTARKTLISAWQERKREGLKHPIIDQTTRVGLLPFVQARILAKAIRGEAEVYVPCVLK